LFSHLDLGQWIIIGLSAFLLIWFFLANLYNRQRGLATYRWLRRGLGQYGEITKSEWLGSSGTGGHLSMAHPARPFRQLEAAYLLETREIMPYWIFTHLRGKRDSITIRGILRKPPLVEYMAGSLNEAAWGELEKVEGEHRYEPIGAPPGFNAFRRGQANAAMDRRLVDLLAAAPKGMKGIVLRRDAPHLTIRSGVGQLIDLPAEEFFKQIGDWLQNS
jgi:hypothetical protein